jgi:hypothetical protein
MDGSVLKVSRCGGQVTVLASGQVEPLDIAVDATNVYWGGWDVYDGTGDNGGRKFMATVMRAPVGGGAATQIWSGSWLVPRCGMAIDSSAVFWMGFVGFPSGMDSSEVPWRAPITGGGPRPLSSAPFSFACIAVDATRVFLSQRGDPKKSNVNRLLTVPSSGGEETVLVPDGVSILGYLAIDSTNVYYQGESANLMRIAKSGGAPQSLAPATMNALAVDGVHVYWVEGNVMANVPGAVKRVPVGGGTVTTMASFSGYSGAIAVDDEYVYWPHNADVIRMPK